MVNLYVIPQVGLVRGSKLTITTAPSACRRIFEDLGINQGCKEKAFHAGVNKSDSQSDCTTICSLAAMYAKNKQIVHLNLDNSSLNKCPKLLPNWKR